MIRLFVVLLIVMFSFSACGVDTSSSSSDANSKFKDLDTVEQNPVNQGDDIQGWDPIEGNPVVDNNETNNPDPGTQDPGTQDPGTPGNGGTDKQKEDSAFDTELALYDENACNPSSYRVVRDASYEGINSGENGAEFAIAIDNGLGIRSEHVEGASAYLEKTWVLMYYKTFPSIQNLGLQGYTDHYLEGVFYLTYDIAWADSSINEIDNTIYIQSEKTTKPTCYRLVLDKIIGTQVGVQKVYR